MLVRAACRPRPPHPPTDGSARSRRCRRAVERRTQWTARPAGARRGLRRHEGALGLRVRPE